MKKYTIIAGKFVVHGILGEIASEQYEDNANKLTKYDLDRIKENGEEMMRIFDTKGEAEAYLQGVEDMQGNDGFCVTSKKDHEKIFGKLNVEDLAKKKK